MTLIVLVTAPYMIPFPDRFLPVLQKAGIELIIPQVKERLSEQELLEYAGHIDGAVSGDDQFSQKVLSAATPRLRVISKWGTGLDSIDREAASSLGVSVYNTPDAFTDPVADSVLAYMLAFARRGPWMDRNVKSGAWEKLNGKALGECSLGVIGVGSIGKAVLKRAQVFGMRLLGNDIVPIEDSFLNETHVEMVGLDELLQQSDFISLNCDLNPSSHHLIGAKAFDLMRPAVVLINTARGPVVDEAELIEALRSERIQGAALDVFEEEPLPANSPLRGMDNVLLAPHNANSSPSAWERVHQNTLLNLFRGLGLPPPNEWQE
jgi:D-3-phosphoglycerate dehydrogenase